MSSCSVIHDAVTVHIMFYSCSREEFDHRLTGLAGCLRPFFNIFMLTSLHGVYLRTPMFMVFKISRTEIRAASMLFLSL